jgi:hypothetical protein
MALHVYHPGSNHAVGLRSIRSEAYLRIRLVIQFIRDEGIKLLLTSECQLGQLLLKCWNG